MITIRECLSKLTADDLFELGFKLMADPPEKKTKAAWVEVLERELRTVDPDRLRMHFTLPELHALRLYAAPMMDDPTAFSVTRAQVKQNEQLEQACGALKYMGLAHRTREGWLIRREAMELTDMSAQQEARLRRRDALIGRLEKPLVLCGAMPLDTVFEAAGIRKGDQDVVDELMETWSARYGFSGVHVVNKEETWLSHPWCDEPQKVIVSQLSGDVSGLPYAMWEAEPTRTVYGDIVPGCVEDYETVLTMLRRSGWDAPEALAEVREIINELQNGRDEAAVERLANAMDNAPSPAQMRQISAFFEHIPLWRLKGHSVAELAGRSHSERKEKPSFNAPCPCGSGRSYGRCCGRRN